MNGPWWGRSAASQIGMVAFCAVTRPETARAFKAHPLVTAS